MIGNVLGGRGLPYSNTPLSKNFFDEEASALAGWRPMILPRRTFIKHATASTILPWLSWAGLAQPDGLIHFRGRTGIVSRPSELMSDVVIVGASLGGCAAALAAARAGATVVLTEETDWIGGQVTSQAVPPDEHPWIESFGCTRSYRSYRNAVRQYYRDHYPMTPSARAQAVFNPGNGWVSRLCHEPRVSLAVISQMLAPFLSSGRLRVLLKHRLTRVEMDHDKVKSITLKDVQEGHSLILSGAYFIDATELGDLLALGKIEHVTGAESQKQTGEPHAPPQPEPDNQQAITHCFAIDHIPDEDHTIDRPADYDFWRSYTPTLKPAWPGRLLSWQTSDPYTLQPRELPFDPTEKISKPNLWTYRRILDPTHFEPGAFASGICLVNWPQNDYWIGPLVGPADDVVSSHLAKARSLSLCLLRWMQTEAPRPDGGVGWKGLRLRPEVVGTLDGLAKAPYIRESRRILADFTVKEQHVSTDYRSRASGTPLEETVADKFKDSVGVGCYRIDLHPSTGQNNYIDLSSLPFQIPLGSLLPRRVENLIAGCKNIGSTHITNGAFRLHPVEWNIGEAAGALAAFCLRKSEPPRQIRNKAGSLADFQASLVRQGFELDWPRLRPL